MDPSYTKAIEYLFGLQWHGIKLGLRNISSLLAALGDPHRVFRAIHVAGTNGKGSTAAMIASILSAAGYRTGLYTSPHLLDFTERIRIDGRPISYGDVSRLTATLRSAADGLPITFFEFTTAMAFRYFAESGADFAVAETGMGGRFDATNTLRPEASVITNVDFDHQAYLGDTIQKIAFEKAGIVKPGVPVITAARRPEALEVIRAACREREAALLRVGEEVRVEGTGPDRFRYEGPRWSLSDLSCPLAGRHQLDNAACALGALESLGPDVIRDEAPLRRGLAAVRWEGRLERIEDPPGEAPVILDGAHNAAGAEALRSYLEEQGRPAAGRLILVMGILRDKDIDEIVDRLAPLADEAVFTRPRYERGCPAEDLRRRGEKLGIPSIVREPVGEAVRYARHAAGAGGRVVVTGSLFTVGEARSYLKGLPQPSSLRG